MTTELKAIADQLNRLNKTMDKLARLIDEITKVEDIEEKLQLLIKLNPESKYLVVFGEEMDQKDADIFNKQLWEHLGENKVFFIGGVELQAVMEIPNDSKNSN